MKKKRIDKVATRPQWLFWDLNLGPLDPNADSLTTELQVDVQLVESLHQDLMGPGSNSRTATKMFRKDTVPIIFFIQ